MWWFVIDVRADRVTRYTDEGDARRRVAELLLEREGEPADVLLFNEADARPLA